MTDEKEPGRFEKILNKSLAAEPEPEKPASFWAETRAVIRRRIIAGVLFLIPIATTVWFLNFILVKVYNWVGPFVRRVLEGSPLLRQLGFDFDSLQQEQIVFKAIILAISILTLLAFLYIVGLLVSRTAFRRLIGLAEDLLVQIPFVKFFYRTTKKIVETVSLPRSQFNKVVVCDFFRPGMKRLGFATGETPIDIPPGYLVNLFVPMTPNITSGFAVLLPPDEVWDTDLTIEEAMAFIISGGILPTSPITLRPYQPRTAQIVEVEELSSPELEVANPK